MIRLGLFFTRHTGLADWHRLGSLARETALYRRLLDEDVQTTFFTYDRNVPVEAQKQIPELECVPIRQAWLQGKLRFLYPGRYGLRKQLQKIDLIKTNQFSGVREAIEACTFYQTPLIARAGYLPSLFAEWSGRPAEAIASYQEAERFLAGRADAIVVTTNFMRRTLQERCHISPEKIHVIGNYVPELFSPVNPNAPTEIISRNTTERFRILTVGRHDPQKRYSLLLQALSQGPGSSDILWRAIGAGDLFDAEHAEAEVLKIPAEFIASVPHEALPDEYRQADIFVLCSQYEGHPKALLEAMACGCACIVTKGPGVDEEVLHEKTGLVVPSDPDALRAAINRLRGDSELRARLGMAAATWVHERYRLDHIAQQERALYRMLLER